MSLKIKFDNCMFKITGHILIIITVWLTASVFSLNWGLPNPSSLVDDAMSPELTHTAQESMHFNGSKYPPLQYHIWKTFFPPEQIDGLSQEEILKKKSTLLLKFRWVVAVMVLGTAVCVYLIGVIFLGLGVFSLLAPIYFVLNPLSTHYRHTTNMDQPYTFWLFASILVFLCSNLAKSIPPKVSNLGNLAFGVFMGCAFCTKDQVYALYLLPLVIYSIREYKIYSLKVALQKILLWCIGFVFTCSTIYLLAGGKEVFLNHFNWITTYGSQGWVQVSGGILGRLELTKNVAREYIIVVGWPCIVFVTGLLLYLRKNLKSIQNLALWVFLPLLSYYLFFAQITLFTYPRFFLPFVALTGLLIGRMSHTVLSGKPKATAIVLSLFIGLVSFQSYQIANNLVSAPAIKVKALFTSNEVGFTGKTLLVGGCEWDNQYLFENGKISPHKTLRDWSDARFGLIIEKQKSSIINDFSISLIQPDIILLGQNAEDKAGLLKSHNYAFAAKIHGTTQYIPTFFWHNFDSLSLYVKRPGGDKSALKKERSISLEQELLIFSSVYSFKSRGNLVKRFGEIASEFNNLDPNYVVPIDYIDVAAIGYDMNARTKSAKKAFDYLVSNSNKPLHHYNAKYFYKKHKLKWRHPKKSQL